METTLFFPFVFLLAAISVDFSKLPEADVVVNFVVNRFKKGLYTLVLIYGLPGTGKSSQCQRSAELIQGKFKEEGKEIKIYIVDSLLDLIKALRKTKPGDIIITEEISVLFPSRRAMAGDNVAISRILDTCRKKQIILFANAPILSSVDSHIRALAHMGIQTLKILKKEKVVVSKPLILQTNPASGKTYYHKLTRNGYDVDRIFTKMPNMEKWNQYEKDKDKFMDELYEKLEFKAEKKKDDELKSMGKGKKKQVIRPLTENELQAHSLVNVQGTKKSEAARIMGVKPPRITQLLKNFDKKTQFAKGNEQNEAINLKNEPSS